MQSRYFSSRSTLWDENSPTTHGSYTASQEATKSAVPSSKPDHIMSAPTIARNTWSKYKYDPVVPAGDTESSDMRFRIPKAGHAVFMPPSRLDVSDVSGIRGQKRQLWATQTMQDVISPKAFEQWTKDQTIPKTPDDMWSASDMRKAYTFKKRQWKLSKPEFKHLKLDTVPSIASRKQPDQQERTQMNLRLRPILNYKLNFVLALASSMKLFAGFYLQLNNAAPSFTKAPRFRRTLTSVRFYSPNAL
jgi:hypothetical protein